jgi:hypothetical protein
MVRVAGLPGNLQDREIHTRHQYLTILNQDFQDAKTTTSAVNG